MARIKIKQVRRCRVQLTVSAPLWGQYQDNLTAAKQVGAEIDFGDEFEVWFRKQIFQVARDLKDLQAESTVKAPRQTGHSSSENVPHSQGKVISAASVAAKISSGGDDHGNN